jgi:hypothetical protein
MKFDAAFLGHSSHRKTEVLFKCKKKMDLGDGKRFANETWDG